MTTTASGDDWDQHWHDYTSEAEQNPAQNYRREIILSLLALEGTGRGVRLLDIGSGQGDMAAAVHARFPDAEILGLELSQTGVEISTRKVPAARFVQRNLVTAQEPPDGHRNWAAYAICAEVIEHVDDPVQLLKNAQPYMAAGCRLIVTAPGGPMSAYDKHLGHRKHWTPDTIRRVLTDAGYSIQNANGIGFPFFNLYRCLVVARGEQLIRDATADQTGKVALPARAAMAIFRFLMRPSLNSSSRGWQMIAQAYLEDART